MNTSPTDPASAARLAAWIRANARRHGGDTVAAARALQTNGWASGAPIPAEQYVAALPDGTTEDHLVLVMGEVELRRERGEAVALAEYARRFPAFADQLAMQFELLDQLGGTDDDGPPDVPGYQLAGQLGRGGAATVYRATHAATGRAVAMKVLAAEFDDHPATRVRFLREGELLAAFDHPNLVRVYECGVAGDRLFLAMELATDGTLANRLDAGPLPMNDARELLAAVADAAAYAHRRNVVHRDIKPSNVLFAAPPGESLPAAGRLYRVPKLTDFGLAKQVGFESGLTSHRQFVGTAAYAAPEQAERAARAVGYQSPEWVVNAASIGPAADVYSLGVVLFECLTGRLPIEGATVAEVCQAKLTADAPDPRAVRPDVSEELAEVCRRSLSRKAAERFSTAEAFADALRAAAPRGRWARWFGG